MNFGFARYHGGICYLRYDDTNPSGEKQEYFESIKDIVEWLGFKPVAITHSSDHFDRLYELAEELIKKDGAYVCHCSSMYTPDAGGVQGTNVEQRPRSKPREAEARTRATLDMLVRTATGPLRSRSLSSGRCGTASTSPRRPICA